MSNSKKDFYKFLVNALIDSKQRGEVEFNANLDTFTKQLDEDLSIIQSIRSIESDIQAVNKRIHFLDDRITSLAKKYYVTITRKPLQRRLISSYENMELFIKNQNIKSACKHLVVQAELLCNHLAFEANLVDWVRKNSPADIYLSGTTDQYLSTWNLLKAVDARFQTQFDKNAFYDIKQLRDYESHGFHESKIATMEILLTKVTSDWKRYYEEGFKFIDKLIIEHYNYP